MNNSQGENNPLLGKHYWALKGLKVVVLVAFFLGVVGWLFMYLWNWIAPDVFNLKRIDYWQALGLLVLCRLLFGGRPGFFHHHHRRHHWKQRLHARWENMSPEEREKFRSGMKSSWCQFSEGRRPARASGISQGSQRP